MSEKSMMCASCGLRWRQGGLAGLCRTCAWGIKPALVIERDRRYKGYRQETADVVAQQEQIRQIRLWESATVTRATRIADGIEYEVVWDGRA